VNMRMLWYLPFLKTTVRTWVLWTRYHSEEPYASFILWGKKLHIGNCSSY
jgi:hypothetical protein